MDESRTEEATPRKLARARQVGLLPRSPDLIAAGALLALLGSLPMWGAALGHALRDLARGCLAGAANPSGPPFSAVTHSLRHAIVIGSYPLCVIVLGAGLAGFVQVGPLFATAAFTPDLRRLDPVTRLVSMFSFDRLREVAWTIAKLVVLLAVGGAVPLSGLRGLLGVASGSAANASGTLIVMLEAVALRIALAAVLVGAVDLVLRHLRHRRAMRMSRRELVQEQRENYGVPEHRERRRRLASEAAVAAALADLDTASVLLLDGRGRALALAFDPHDQAQRAPRVVAKAHGAAVARLWAKAEQCGIGVRMQPSLVAALFPLELTEAVPHAHYAAVAEVWRELVTRPTSTP